MNKSKRNIEIEKRICMQFKKLNTLKNMKINVAKFLILKKGKSCLLYNQNIFETCFFIASISLIYIAVCCGLRGRALASHNDVRAAVDCLP